MLFAAGKHCAHCNRELEEQAKAHKAAEQGPLQQGDTQHLPKPAQAERLWQEGPGPAAAG
jgi:hypothetical protein